MKTAITAWYTPSLQRYEDHLHSVVRTPFIVSRAKLHVVD